MTMCKAVVPTGRNQQFLPYVYFKCIFSVNFVNQNFYEFSEDNVFSISTFIQDTEETQRKCIICEYSLYFLCVIMYFENRYKFFIQILNTEKW